MADNFNTRTRNWFLTVNKGAECFDNFSEIVECLQKCTYAYIKHTDTDNEHYHALLVFDNARAFTAITKLFKGARVDASHSINAVASYLLHKTTKAREANKKEYQFEDIITNDIGAVRSWLGAKAIDYDSFNPDKIVDYYLFGNCRSFFDFYAKFGSQIQKYIPLIDRICKELDTPDNAECLRFIDSKIKPKNVYNGYSETPYNSTNCYIYCGRSFHSLIDLMIRFADWLILDNEGLDYIRENRKDIVEKYKIDDFNGLDVSYVREHMINCADNNNFDV